MRKLHLFEQFDFQLYFQLYIQLIFNYFSTIHSEEVRLAAALNPSPARFELDLTSDPVSNQTKLKKVGDNATQSKRRTGRAKHSSPVFAKKTSLGPSIHFDLMPPASPPMSMLSSYRQATFTKRDVYFAEALHSTQAPTVQP